MAENASEEAPPKKPRRVRLREALNRRDWLGLAFELAVVTIGVLLAFQIDQWGDRRKQTREERHFLERLYRENQASARELTELLQIHNKVVKEVGSAIRTRNDLAQLAPMAQRRDFGCRSASMQTASYNDTAFEELLSSGRINLISDLELRALIRDLAASQARGAAEVEHGREQLAYTLPNLDPYYSLTVGEKDEPICYIDWPALVRDRVALTSATRLARRHYLIAEARQETLALTRRVQQRLACVLEKQRC